jgi:hypothetical protein
MKVELSYFGVDYKSKFGSNQQHTTDNQGKEQAISQHTQ